MNKNGEPAILRGSPFMEHTGLEPVTSTLPVWRAPNCANAPKDDLSYASEFIISDRRGIGKSFG